MRRIRMLPMASATRGPLAQGCEQCGEGRKMVLFVSGLCPFRCFYCTVSEKRNQKDVTYANERLVHEDKDVIAEARAMGAAGTGITGGDPLFKIDRVLHYVRLLKGTFGKSHHIHIYTREPNEAKVRALAEAGLDELRFHIPHYQWGDVEKRGSAFRNILNLAPQLGLKRGVEIPLIPDKETELRKLLATLSSIGVDFVNLNEFEFSETNEGNLRERGYHVNPNGGWGVNGSAAVAHRLLRKDWRIPVHFCSSGFKDSVQLRQRLIRRGQRTARRFDVLTEDGTVIRGVVEVPERGLSLDEAAEYVAETLSIGKGNYHVNADRHRIEVPPYLLRRLARSLSLPAFEVEEYPTEESLEVERSPLNAPALAFTLPSPKIRTAG